MKSRFLLPLLALVLAFTACEPWEDYYTQGGADISGRVDEMEIDWTSGLVQVRYHDQGYISIFEEGGTRALYHRYDGRRLKIRGRKRATLQVWLPTDMILNTVEMETTSADIDADIDCNFLDVETVSGNVDIQTFVEPRIINLETVSGDIHLGMLREANFTVDFDSVSGDLFSDFTLSGHSGHFSHGYGGTRISIETVSGDAEIYRID